MNTSLKINDTEYCIKLSRDSFDLGLIKQLLGRMQSEQLFFSKKEFDAEDDIISKTFDYEVYENFDRLGDK